MQDQGGAHSIFPVCYGCPLPHELLPRDTAGSPRPPWDLPIITAAPGLCRVEKSGIDELLIFKTEHMPSDIHPLRKQLGTSQCFPMMHQPIRERHRGLPTTQIHREMPQSIHQACDCQGRHSRSRNHHSPTSLPTHGAWFQ